MDGIVILLKEPITEISITNALFVLGCFVIMEILISIFLYQICLPILFPNLDINAVAPGIIILIVFIMTTIYVFLINSDTMRHKTGRYRYKVTIDENVRFIDVMNKYDIIENDGKIWIIEDKEK